MLVQLLDISSQKDVEETEASYMATSHSLISAEWMEERLQQTKLQKN